MLNLSENQREQLFEQGFVRVPNAIPRERVDAALRAINHSLGEGMDPAKLTTLRSQSYCPELQKDAVITDLYNATLVKALAESLMGAGQIKPITAGQIALRFPGMQAQPVLGLPHLDGMYTPNNGVPKGRILSFTMLLGIMLNDVSTDWAGNLAVWPGTHRMYENYFRQHGPEALLTGMPPIAMPAPVQLTGNAGDAVLVHYQVAHAAAPNVSANVRYAIYFRLIHVQHDAQWKQAMTDIWMEWPGMENTKTSHA